MKRLLSGILDKYDAAAVAKGYPADLALAIVSYIGSTLVFFIRVPRSRSFLSSRTSAFETQSRSQRLIAVLLIMLPIAKNRRCTNIS
jgi:hypothetical protein